MVTVTREFTFAMGHTLTDYPGDCARLHGHNYRLLVEVGYTPDPVSGMVVDFADLKKLVDPIVDRLDHHFMIWQGDPRAVALVDADNNSMILVGNNPTAENIGTMLGEEIAAAIKARHGNTLFLHSTTLWENGKSYATHVYG